MPSGQRFLQPRQQVTGPSPGRKRSETWFCRPRHQFWWDRSEKVPSLASTFLYINSYIFIGYISIPVSGYARKYWCRFASSENLHRGREQSTLLEETLTPQCNSSTVKSWCNLWPWNPFQSWQNSLSSQPIWIENHCFSTEAFNRL